MVRKQSSWFPSLKQPGKLQVQDFCCKKYIFIKHSSRLRHVGPAVAPQFEIKRVEREPKTRFSPPLTVPLNFCAFAAIALSVYSVFSIVYRFSSCRINSPFQPWLSFQVCLCPFFIAVSSLELNNIVPYSYISKFGFCVIAKWVFTT